MEGSVSRVVSCLLRGYTEVSSVILMFIAASSFARYMKTYGMAMVAIVLLVSQLRHTIAVCFPLRPDDCEECGAGDGDRMEPHLVQTKPVW